MDVRTPRGLHAAAGGSPMRLEIHSGGSRLDQLLVETLRIAIRGQGGDPRVIGRGR